MERPTRRHTIHSTGLRISNNAIGQCYTELAPMIQKTMAELTE